MSFLKNALIWILSFIATTSLSLYILANSYEKAIEPSFINQTIKNITKKLYTKDINKSLSQMFVNLVVNNKDFMFKILKENCKFIKNFAENFFNFILDLGIKCEDLEKINSYNEFLSFLSEKIYEKYGVKIEEEKIDSAITNAIINYSQYFVNSSEFLRGLMVYLNNVSNKVLEEINKIDCKENKIFINFSCVKENPQYLISENFYNYIKENKKYLLYLGIFSLGFGSIISKSITFLVSRLLTSYISLLPLAYVDLFVKKGVEENLKVKEYRLLLGDIMKIVERFSNNLKSQIIFPIEILSMVYVALKVAKHFLKKNI